MHGHAEQTCKPADTGLENTGPTYVVGSNGTRGGNTRETPANSEENVLTATGLFGPLEAKGPTFSANPGPELGQGKTWSCGALRFWSEENA